MPGETVRARIVPVQNDECASEERANDEGNGKLGLSAPCAPGKKRRSLEQVPAGEPLGLVPRYPISMRRNLQAPPHGM